MAFPIAQCKSCHAPIIWGLTRNDTPMPIDAEPTPDGNVLVLEDRSVVVLGPLELSIHNHDEQPLRMPHHATCPDAGMWTR